jgi:hypothetical protein
VIPDSPVKSAPVLLALEGWLISLLVLSIFINRRNRFKQSEEGESAHCRDVLPPPVAAGIVEELGSAPVLVIPLHLASAVALQTRVKVWTPPGTYTRAHRPWLELYPLLSVEFLVEHVRREDCPVLFQLSSQEHVDLCESVIQRLGRPNLEIRSGTTRLLWWGGAGN